MKIDPHNPDTRIHLGELPPARSGTVAFFANLQHIFFDNQALTDELRATVHTLDSYGGRLLPVLGLLWDGPDNILILERPPLPGFHEYLTHTLGLSLPHLLFCGIDDAITPEIESAVRNSPGCFIDGFVTDERLAQLSASTGTPLAGSVHGSRAGNNKFLLHHFLQDQGEPVFDTIDADNPDAVAPAGSALASQGYEKIAIKAAVGASGIGLVHAAANNPPPIPAHYFADGPCLVQGWIDDSLSDIVKVTSPSVQLLITENSVHLYDLTDQILSIDSIHEGNIAPPESPLDADVREELLRQAKLAALWLHAQNYRGTGSTDFHLAFHEDGHVDVRICEINARVTGATYPSLLARHFQKDGTWLMRNLLLSDPLDAREVFDQLSQADLLYSPGRETGVLPVNFNSTPDGLVAKGQFLILGPDHQSLHDTMSRTLHQKNLHFTRD